MPTQPYDALVLVHPDFLFGPDEELPVRYLNALRREVAAYEKDARKIFLYPSLRDGDDARNLHPDLRGLLQNAAIVPKQPNYDTLSDEENVSLQAQAEVDFIAGIIGKQPKDIAVGFGGIISDACVYAIAKWTCSRVRTRYPGDLLWRSRAPRKLRYGHVLDDLVVHVDAAGAPTLTWCE